MRPTALQIATDLLKGSKANLKKVDGGYMTICPAHNDRTPSLSVREAEDGRIIATCFGCGAERAKLYSAMEQKIGYALNPIEKSDRKSPEKKAIAVKQTKRNIRVITPVPASAPDFASQARSKTHGNPTSIWTYHDTQGQVVGHVCRYQNDTEKLIWPWVCAEKDGRPQWVVHQLPSPRPLYNAHEITKSKPGTPILFVEGEKVAEAGRKLFPSWIPTTTIGGCSAPHLSDFSILKGRTIIISPDNDQPGMQYAADVAQLCAKAGANEILMLRFPDTYKIGAQGLCQEPYIHQEGDDLHDHLERGWTTEDLRTVQQRGIVLQWKVDPHWPAA
ncbi:MAG: DNA primase [Firmicutes bacterium]|nr:DNA primase [Bacillota bacterium]